jgi:probable inactive protein kinase-like protein SgK071
MNWSAPEVLEKPYDERSDVWSLGCILLELMSTAFCDKATMAGKLFEIKHNPQALKELLDQAGQVRGQVVMEIFVRQVVR